MLRRPKDNGRRVFTVKLIVEEVTGYGEGAVVETAPVSAHTCELTFGILEIARALSAPTYVRDDLPPDYIELQFAGTVREKLRAAAFGLVQHATILAVDKLRSF
jgi:hypothetical protein